MLATLYIQGGSLGKGTAVKGKSDIDLVIFLRNYSDVRTLRRNLSSHLKTLKDRLESYNKIRVVGETLFAVQVEMPCQAGYIHSVDVLPSVDLDNCKCPLKTNATDMANNTTCYNGLSKYGLPMWFPGLE